MESTYTSEILKLVKALRDGKVPEIKPGISGEVSYQQVEDLTGLDSTGAEALVRSLESQNILLGIPSDCVFTCPGCGSARLVYRLRCPACANYSLKPGQALEHMHCGHVDFEEAFLETEELRCPKCMKPLKAIGVDYRRIGNYYQCIHATCKDVTASPDQVFHCIKCSQVVSIDKAAIKIYDSYRLNPEGSKKIEKYTIDYSMVADVLQSYGFEAKFDSTIRGKSGVYHEFPIIAYHSESGGDDKKPDIIMDAVISSEEVGEESTMSVMVKKVDVGIEIGILAVVPSLTESARKLASFYGLTIVESANTAGLAKQMAEAVEKTVGKLHKDV